MSGIVDDSLNDSIGSNASLNEYKPPSENCLYDTQQIAPAPGSTYYQLIVKSKDLVILRDWPKMRMSQKWSRSGNFNPGEKKMTAEEFLNGEAKDQLIFIFGDEKYNAAIEVFSGITVQADILGGLSVDEKGLITDSPSHDDILENHGEWAKGMAHIKTSPFPALAYVTPWNSKGYDIAKWFSGKFSYISPVWFTVRPQGKDGWTIEGEYKCGHDVDNEWLSQTRNFSLNDNGETAVKIVPRFQLANIDRDVFTALTTRPEVTAKIAGMILEQCTNFNFDGAVIEVMAPSVFPDLVKAVSKALKAEGLDLILVIGPQRGDANDPTNFKREHFANLVDHVDAFSLMTYDFSHPKNPGPNSPIKWVEKSVVALTADQEERKKILVGINLYGNDYIESEQEGGPIVGHQYLEILSTQKPDIMWESLHCEHTLSYTDNNGKDHTVYYPTLRSIRERLDLAAELGCGVSMWEIGQGLDYFYDLF